MLKANYHTHTSYCDGKSTPEEIVQEALNLGFEHLGFSSHIDISPVMDVPAYLDEIRRIQKKYNKQIDIICGGELDNMYPERKPQGFDYLIGSVHHMDADGEILAVDWKEEQLMKLLDYYGDGYKLCKAYFELIAETYSKGSCYFIGHFDLVTRYNQKYNFVDEEDPRYLNSAFEVIEYLVKEELPLEINTRQSHWGKIYPSKFMLKKLRELDGEIIISSDAHHASELMKGFEQAVELAKSCGFDHTNILARTEDGVKYLQIPI